MPARAGFKPVGGSSRTAKRTNGGALPREAMRRRPSFHELANPKLPRKAPVELTAVVTVPQTDTGRRGENPKAFERSLPKELGKLTP